MTTVPEDLARNDVFIALQALAFRNLAEDEHQLKTQKEYGVPHQDWIRHREARIAEWKKVLEAYKL